MSATSDLTSRSRDNAWRHGLVVAAVAVLVRAAYLWQSSSGPFFHEPLVDASTYHNLARGLAQDGVYTEHFLWQAPLYPLFLAALYALFGVSVALARTAGAVLAVGLAVALNGVLVFFDGELLATGLTTFWTVAIVSLGVSLAARPRPFAGLLLGCAGALAILTRPVLLLPLLVVLGWVFRPRGASWRPLEGCSRSRTILAVGLGAVMVLGSFAAVTKHHIGRTGLWPPSGGINFYIGNHPDFPLTLLIRPGLPWEELIARPLREAGLDDPWVSSAWYRDRTLEFIGRQPALWLAVMGQKGLHFLSGRELPRNVDIDEQRTWSSLLGILLWKAGPFSFPAGVLLPLAFVGLAAARRRLPAVIALFVGSYAAVLLLVFVSSRYRAPLWPACSSSTSHGGSCLPELLPDWSFWRFCLAPLQWKKSI